MVERQFANLHTIVTSGFDRLNPSGSPGTPSTAGDHNLFPLDDFGSFHVPDDGSTTKSKNPDPPATPCAMDHPKLVAAHYHFLKGVDLSHPALASELNFAEAVAARNNPTTTQNLRDKFKGTFPPFYAGWTKEQQEGFCRLVDCAEMKYMLRIELRDKERKIREQELKYLSTDFGLGNVVHGWDLSAATASTGTERQISTGRLTSRRKVKDSDRIFSSSSVMSFSTGQKFSKTKRLEVKKKKEKFRKGKKKQLMTQRQRLNAYRDGDSYLDSEDESVGGDEYQLTTEKESEALEEEKNDLNDMHHHHQLLFNKKAEKKHPFTVEKKAAKIPATPAREPHSASAGLSTPINPLPKLQKNTSEKQDIQGQRLKMLLTNKTPHPTTSSSVYSTQHLIPIPTGTAGQSLKMKIYRSPLTGHPEVDKSSSPAPSNYSSFDSPNPTASGMPKRNRGRPRRLES